MPSLREVFPNTRHQIFPVIHITSEDQAIRNAEIAKTEGADGVFLISMTGADFVTVLETSEAVAREFPDLWIGVNLLDISAVSAFGVLSAEISGLWTDDARISEEDQSQIRAESISRHRTKARWDGLYFGGVAFKYQAPVQDVAVATRIARDYMDVITTSGAATGCAPEVLKLEKMRIAVGDHPIAIASGINSENVRKFLAFVNCFLVASSLLKPGTEDFDGNKVRRLVQTVREYSPR